MEGMKVRAEGFKKLTPVGEALRVIYRSGLPEVGSEVIPTVVALGRVLSEDVVSQANMPPFDRTAVDGYAIKFRESFSASRNNPAVFRVKGQIEAGKAQKGEDWSIGSREAYEVFTGAPIPKGADAVVMVEDTGRCGEAVEVYRSVPRLANVSPKGEDIAAGERLLKAGTVIKPWHIGALASIGTKVVRVKKRVSVGVLSTGSELVDLAKAKPSEGAIVDSTRPMIIAALEALGCTAVDGGITGDDLRVIAKRIGDLQPRVDAIVTIGGTSVGGKDLVPDAILEASGRIMFHGLAIKPGKPAGFASVEGKPLFMLPGYPVSALVGFEAVVEHVLCTMMGRHRPKRRTLRAKVSRRVPTTPGIRHYLRVVLKEGKGGLLAEPIAITGSGLLSSVTKADGIVVIGEDLEGLEKGDEVEVELLEGNCDE
jgi:molybdopterin molybdotransferase